MPLKSANKWQVVNIGISETEEIANLKGIKK